jgi:hypothetical protein
MIFDFDNVPTEEKTYYFDNIAIANAECAGGSTGVRNLNIEALRMMPNPTNGEVTMLNAEKVDYFEVIDLVGHRLMRVQTIGQSSPTLDISFLPAGIYLVNGFSREGELKANGKLVKQ